MLTVQLRRQLKYDAMLLLAKQVVKAIWCWCCIWSMQTQKQLRSSLLTRKGSKDRRLGQDHVDMWKLCLANSSVVTDSNKSLQSVRKIAQHIHLILWQQWNTLSKTCEPRSTISYTI